MLHAFRIKNGQLWYCNRFTQTDHFKIEKEAGKAVFPKLGEYYHVGVFLSLIFNLMGKVGYIKERKNFEENTANTAMINHAKRTFALVEVDKVILVVE